MMVLFVGGPLHGKWHPIPGDQQHIYWRPIQPPNVNRPHTELRPCLELLEIQGLTGSTMHRNPNRPVREEMEKQQLSTRLYSRRQFLLDLDEQTRSVFVLEGYEPDNREVARLLIQGP